MRPGICKTVGIFCFFLLAGSSVTMASEIGKKIEADARQASDDILETSTEIKDVTIETGKQIKDGAIEAGKAVKEGAVNIGHEFKKAFHETKKAITDSISGDHPEVATDGETADGGTESDSETGGETADGQP